MLYALTLQAAAGFGQLPDRFYTKISSRQLLRCSESIRAANERNTCTPGHLSVLRPVSHRNVPPVRVSRLQQDLLFRDKAIGLCAQVSDKPSVQAEHLPMGFHIGEDHTTRPGFPAFLPFPGRVWLCLL